MKESPADPQALAEQCSKDAPAMLQASPPDRPAIKEDDRTYAEMAWQFGRDDLERPDFAWKLLDARLCGRHGALRRTVLYGVDPKWFTDDQKTLIFAAYAQGVRDRAAGVACLCVACITPLREFPQAERIEYRSRRYAELLLSGVDHDEACSRINQELKGEATP